jgi:hypothetical protein
MQRRNGFILGIAVSFAATCGTAWANTGLCVSEPAFGQEWEIEVLTCSGIDCVVEMDRTGFTPIPSAGGLRISGGVLFLSWGGNFSGATQGNIEYDCEFDISGGLPATGPGALIRDANFSPGGNAEFITGTCRLFTCGTATVTAGEADRLTNR